MKVEHARRNVRKRGPGEKWARYLPWNARGDRKQRRILKTRLTRARRLLDRVLEKAGDDGQA
jgi:hypothetical protein